MKLTDVKSDIILTNHETVWAWVHLKMVASCLYSPPWPCFFFSLLLAGSVIQCAAGAGEPGEAVVPETVSFDTGGLSREAFPKGFLFGTATSAYQVEGMAHKEGRGPSIWDVFIQKPGQWLSKSQSFFLLSSYFILFIFCAS